jgi:hypothetical protein
MVLPSYRFNPFQVPNHIYPSASLTMAFTAPFDNPSLRDIE